MEMTVLKHGFVRFNMIEFYKYFYFCQRNHILILINI